MPGGAMQLLNERGMPGGRFQQDMAERGHLAAALAREAHGEQTCRPGGAQGRQHVGAVAGSGNAQQQIAFAPQRFHLTGENLAEVQVIADGGQG